VYGNLPATEKCLLDFYLWAGCGMHKDLNCVKGGNAAMQRWWADNGVSGPFLLANKDNAAILDHADDSDDYDAVEQQAVDKSSGGGVKLASLAGMVFNNKNDKVVQQNVHEGFFLPKSIPMQKFPDTSNTHYQCYCNAAAELITHLKLILNLWSSFAMQNYLWGLPILKKMFTKAFMIFQLKLNFVFLFFMVNSSANHIYDTYKHQGQSRLICLNWENYT
jgi:hypothetical protein